MSLTTAPPSQPTEALSEYIRVLTAGLPVPGSGFRRFIGSLIPRSYRWIVRRVATNLLAPVARGAARKLEGAGPLQLHLGCGESPKQGWVNIDLVGLPVDLAWNLDQPLPFSDGSVDAIFHEHVLEHLVLDRGYTLLRESYRVLKPGGVLRIGVPDAGRYVRSYCDRKDGFLERVRPDRPTALLALQEEFYSHGHRTMYDFETLALVCRAAGFTRIDERGIDETRLLPSPDSPHRKWDTLYVEAVR